VAIRGGFCSRRNRGIAKASPSFERRARRCHKGKLTDNKSHQPRKFFLHETIRMEPDAEHVHSEPRETRHHIAEDRHDHESALANKSAPACMQNDSAPENDQDGAIFFRVPTPEPAPRLIGPDPAEDGAHETEERGKADDAIGHPRHRIGCGAGERASKNPPYYIYNGEHTGEKHG